MSVSRRELLKKSAAAGGLAWAAPVVRSTAAWASDHSDFCNETCADCGDGTLVYAKFAPGNSQTDNNQCLAPPPLTKSVSFDCLSGAGLVTTDVVRSNDDIASLNFDPGRVKIIRLAIKSDNSNLQGNFGQTNQKGGCLMVRCQEGLVRVYNFEPSANPPANSEPRNSELDGAPSPAVLPSPPVFTSKGESNTTYPSNGPGATEACEPIKHVAFDTNGLTPSGGRHKLNFIEMLLCIRNASTIPCIVNAT